MVPSLGAFLWKSFDAITEPPAGLVQDDNLWIARQMIAKLRLQHAGQTVSAAAFAEADDLCYGLSLKGEILGLDQAGDGNHGRSRRTNQ